MKGGATLSPQPLDGKPLVDSEKPKYAAPQKKSIKPEKNYKAAEKFAPNKDKPTTADAKKGLLDIISAVAQVDPNGLSSIAPMMFPLLGQIASAAAGSSEANRKQTIEDAFSGALSLLTNKYTFEQITLVFDTALANDGIELIDPNYRTVVKNSLANLYKNYLTYGEGNIPVNTPSTVQEIGTAPSPLVEFVPDLYVKQYYAQSLDPYPGYIKWLSQEGTDAVYTIRTIGDPYYTTADEEVYSEAEKQLAISLEPYIIENNLTPQLLNEMLTVQEDQVEQNAAEATGGKNSSKQVMSLLMQLAGYAGVIADIQQKMQLPMSVLDKGGITKSHTAFMKNMGEIRQAKDKARSAIKPLSPVSGLVSAIGAVSSVSGAVESAQNVLNTTAHVKSLYDKITG